MIIQAGNLPAQMKFEIFEERDLLSLPELQPPGWGDLVPRFRHFIQAPFCFPIKISFNEKMIGIGASICHVDSAWLACIVIHPAHRNQGLGTIITKKLMDDLDQSKYQTIFLDATQLGFPIYQKLGFVTELEYLHLKTEGDCPVSTDLKNIVSYSEQFYNAVLELDEWVSGEDRRLTLISHIADAKLFLKEKELQGFYLPGLSDGPIVAMNEEAGLTLMNLRLQTRNFSIFPESNKAALKMVLDLHFNHYRSSKRMRWGKTRPWMPQMLFNRISGQLG
jgi:N-acetylglutamate synthase-like GNAT family acetyltransferase